MTVHLIMKHGDDRKGFYISTPQPFATVKKRISGGAMYPDEIIKRAVKNLPLVIELIYKVKSEYNYDLLTFNALFIDLK